MGLSGNKIEKCELKATRAEDYIHTRLEFTLAQDLGGCKYRMIRDSDATMIMQPFEQVTQGMFWVSVSRSWFLWKSQHLQSEIQRRVIFGVNDVVKWIHRFTVDLNLIV
jgi:hypothetical protein